MTDNETAGRVPSAPGQEGSVIVTNVIDFLTREKQQTGETPLPLVMGGGVLRCGRCARTFTSPTWHCAENMREDADGLAFHTDVCRRCAYMDPDLSNWQDLCDVLDSIDEVMKGAAGQPARDVLAAFITRAAEHFSVWRWPEDQPPYVPGDDGL